MIAILAWLLTLTAQTPIVTNPGVIAFDCADHDQHTAHQVFVHTAGAWPTVLHIGDPPAIDGTVTAKLDTRALAPGEYFATVRAGVDGVWGPDSANSNSFVVTDQSPVNQPPPTVQMDVTSCRVTLRATPPDSSSGWRAQFMRDGATNVGNRDAEAPYERSTTLAAGPHTFSVRWTKPDGTLLVSDLAEVACPFVPPPPPVNCAGTWSEWTRATDSGCVGGQRTLTETRTFTIATPPANGGLACPASPESRTIVEPCQPPPPTETLFELSTSATAVDAGTPYTLSYAWNALEVHRARLDGTVPPATCSMDFTRCVGAVQKTQAFGGTFTHTLTGVKADGSPFYKASVAVAVTGPPPPDPEPPPTNPANCGQPEASPTAGNAYFNSLLARKDCWRAYSLRDARTYQKPREGGLLYSDNLVSFWAFDGTMNAARLTIPEFAGTPSNIVSSNLSATDTTITFVSAPGDYAPGVSLKIGPEVVQLTSYVNPTTKIASVLRGTRGTTPTPQFAGVQSYLSNNSAKNMIVLPLGTQDGNTYFFAWDSYWTESYRFGVSGNNYYKAWQFVQDGTWAEPRMRFDGGELSGPQRPGFDISQHVAALDFRLYYPGPNVTAAAPAAPMVGQFHAVPGKWLRHFALIEQRANDYELLTVWAADETRGPVKLIDRLQVNLRSDKPNTIDAFWLELDTSQDTILTRQVGLNLVSYHRNFVALINPPEAKPGADITPLLQRPVPSVR